MSFSSSGLGMRMLLDHCVVKASGADGKLSHTAAERSQSSGCGQATNRLQG